MAKARSTANAKFHNTCEIHSSVKTQVEFAEQDCVSSFRAPYTNIAFSLVQHTGTSRLERKLHKARCGQTFTYLFSLPSRTFLSLDTTGTKFSHQAYM